MFDYFPADTNLNYRPMCAKCLQPVEMVGVYSCAIDLNPGIFVKCHGETLHLQMSTGELPKIVFEDVKSEDKSS